MALAVAMLADEAGTTQHTQVVRGDLLGHPEFRRDFPDCPGPFTDQGQDPAPVAVGQSLPGDLLAAT